jgi:lipopolysaccharide export LptBFGC system permease protein LptF
MIKTVCLIILGLLGWVVLEYSSFVCVREGLLTPSEAAFSEVAYILLASLFLARRAP